jgi:hypothetical protein
MESSGDRKEMKNEDNTDWGMGSDEGGIVSLAGKQEWRVRRNSVWSKGQH